MTIRATLRLALADATPRRGALLGLVAACGEVVHLSPHYDDTCFSLGILARSVARGQILNLFTRDAYAPRHGIRWATDAETVTRAVAIREAEDIRFAAECRLVREDLGLDSAALRGRGSRDLAGLADDRRQLDRPLRAALDRIERAAPPDRPIALFVPAGIGGHVNHVAVMTFVAQADLGPRWRAFFYEDLPYAAAKPARRQGLLRLLDLMRGRPARHVLPFAAPEKLRLVNLYPSQFTEDVTDLARFTPAARPHAPHEAVWTFD